MRLTARRIAAIVGDALLRGALRLRGVASRYKGQGKGTCDYSIRMLPGIEGIATECNDRAIG
jgi:hypothetical protein